MGHLPYAGAMATALVVGMGVIGLMTPGDLEQREPPGRRTIAASQPQPTPVLTLETAPPQSPSLVAHPFDAAQRRRESTHVPRYVIDARPVSYERPFKF